MKILKSKKKFLFQLNHPAHFHLFKNAINILQTNGHIVLISIKDKDILKELVKDYQYVQLSEGYRKRNIFSIIKSVISRDRKLYGVVKKLKPDLMIGTSPEIGHISPFVHVPAIFFGEDDVNLSVAMYLGALSCYPMFNKILAPTGVNNGIWNNKTLFYRGFQKLAYLHPNYFKPNRSKVNVPVDERFFILRFANLQAYHDINAKGISNSLAIKLIKILKEHGRVLISSERVLPDNLKEYEFIGDKRDIHHYMYYADLFIGDSQSMAVEAAILGTPNIRFNDFIGRISILEEIEKKYNLSYGINSNNPVKLIETVKSVILERNIQSLYKARRDILLADKIDVTAFFVWFFENYPQSVEIMKRNPEFQNKFK